MPVDSSSYLDGSHIRFISDELKPKDSIWIHVRSRHEQPALYDVLDPLFNVLHTHLQGDWEKIYFNVTEMRVDRDVFVRQIPRDTLTLKVKSFDAANKDCISQLNEAITKVPGDKPFIVELFASTDTKYLKMLLKRNSDIYWKTSEEGKKILFKIGVDRKRIRLFRGIQVGEKW